MTLFKRLFFVMLLGLALASGYLFWGEAKLRAMQGLQTTPATTGDATPVAAPTLKPLYGEYRARSKNGLYVLTLNAIGAEMQYTDPAGHRYAYRGHYTVDSQLHAMQIVWREQHADDGWKSITDVPDNMTIVSRNEIKAEQREFVRAGNR